MGSRTLADDFAFFQDLWYGRPEEAQSYGLLSHGWSTNSVSTENPRATWPLPRQQRRHADRQHRKHVERELRKIHG